MSAFDAKHNKRLQLTARSHVSQGNLILPLESRSHAAAEAQR